MAKERGKDRSDGHPQDLPEDLIDHDTGGGEVAVNLGDIDRVLSENADKDARRRTGGEQRKDGKEGKDGKKKPAEGEEDDDIGGLHVLGDDDETEKEREEIRKRRREERRERRARRAERDSEREGELETLRQQVATLTQQIGGVTQNNVESALAGCDQGMEEARRQYSEAQSLYSKAVTEQKGEAATLAQEALNSAREKYRALELRKSQIINWQRQEIARQRSQPSPQLLAHARKFISDHDDWYDPNGRDRDSARVRALDNKLTAEGWDPNTPGYWEELRERVREALPHRFDDEDDDHGDDLGEDDRGRDRDRNRDRGRDGGRERDGGRRQTTSGSGREGGSGDGTNGRVFRLSQARIAAMKEAGLWEDEKKRARQILVYKQYDEKQRRQQQRG